MTDYDSTKFRKVINVNLSGKEYLDFLRYEDYNQKRNLKKFWKVTKQVMFTLRYFIVALVVWMLGRIIIDTLYPRIPVTFDFGILHIGWFVIPYILVYIVIIIIAVAWLFHGVGFVLIKR